MAPQRPQHRRRSHGTAGASLLLGGVAVALWAAPSAFVTGPLPRGSATEATTVEASSAMSRRDLMAAAVGTAALLAPGVQPALADRPPDAVIVSGREGGRAKEMNGRWSIVFGKKVNNKVVYKKDGQAYYLLYNDCGQFQMSETSKGACDGFGINNKGVWTIDGKEDAATKVKPVGAEAEPAETEAQKAKKVQQAQNLNEAIAREQGRMMAEVEVNTFMGNMDKTDDDSAQRLMNKMGAKIVKGM